MIIQELTKSSGSIYFRLVDQFSTHTHLQRRNPNEVSRLQLSSFGSKKHTCIEMQMHIHYKASAWESCSYRKMDMKIKVPFVVNCHNINKLTWHNSLHLNMQLHKWRSQIWKEPTLFTFGFVRSLYIYLLCLLADPFISIMYYYCCCC